MRFLIQANGEVPSSSLLSSLYQRCNIFVAADGGGNSAVASGYQPDVVIGDLDSFSKENSGKSQIIHDPDQETNDLEKALQYALHNGALNIDVVGATGLRTDQTLKNLSVMQQFSSRLQSLAFWDDRLFMTIIPDPYSITLPPGHLVSLFPLSGKVEGITTSGLRYPLNNEVLENGCRDGTSNEVLTGNVVVSHRSGALLFMTTTGKHLL